MLVGLSNGALVRFVGINPVITTIATLSVVQGIALYLRPSPFGAISDDFVDLFQTRDRLRPGLVLRSFSLAAIARRYLALSHAQRPKNARGRLPRGGRQAQRRARRFRPHAGLSPVRRDRRDRRLVPRRRRSASAIPSSAPSYTLTSIAAAVLGGAALTGGRGSFVGAAARRALLHADRQHHHAARRSVPAPGIITSGALTLFAVLLYSGLAADRAACLRATVRDARFEPARRGRPERHERLRPIRCGRPRRRRASARVIRAAAAPDALRGDLDRACSASSVFCAVVGAAQPAAVDVSCDHSAGGVSGDRRHRRDAGADGARHRSVDPGDHHACRARSFSAFRGGRDDACLAAIVAALCFSRRRSALINGVLVAVFELNALIVTLAVGAITSRRYAVVSRIAAAEARVPPGMADLGRCALSRAATFPSGSRRRWSSF